MQDVYFLSCHAYPIAQQQPGACRTPGPPPAQAFGIPVVVNLPGTMARLKEDDPLHINGRLGRVSILGR